MNREQTVKEILDEYADGLLTGAGLSGRLLQVLAGADIDAQLAEVSHEALDWVLWELRDNYAPIAGHEPASYGIIEGVTVHPSQQDEYLLGLARREEHLRMVEVPWVQRWLRAHPLPAREPFPSAIVRGLHTRVAADRETLWASKASSLGPKEWRTWPERKRYDDLLSLEIELEKAVQRAELGGAGSQEQALAWEGFDRVAHLLVSREDLSPEEREAAVEARQRRGDRAGWFLP
jgi:hypothetical protein